MQEERRMQTPLEVLYGEAACEIENYKGLARIKYISSFRVLK